MPQINETAAKPETIIMIHAPAGSGKSTIGGSLSKHFVARPVVERTSQIILSDLLWLQLDRDGLKVLQALGLEPHFYELSARPEDAAMFVSALLKKLDEVPSKMKELGCEYLVVDTLTSLAMYLDSFYLAKDALSAKPNIQRAHGTSQAVFRQIVGKLVALPCKQLWLSHSRSAYINEDSHDASTEAALARTKAMRPGNYDVTPGFTPGNMAFLQNIPSLILAIEAAADGKRSIITSEGLGYYTKNRLGSLLAPREQPNLRKLVNKIEAIENQIKTTI